MVDTALGASCALFIIVLTTLSRRHGYPPHFTGENTEVHRVRELGQAVYLSRHLTEVGFPSHKVTGSALQPFDSKVSILTCPPGLRPPTDSGAVHLSLMHVVTTVHILQCVPEIGNYLI